jgi:flagellar hook protein FlgE
MAISNNISSIQSHQSMMNVNANNIANVNSNGFVPSSTRMSNDGTSVSANSRVADNNGSLKSQTDLTKEIPDQMVVQNVTAANVTAIKTQDEMLGSLLDMKA